MLTCLNRILTIAILLMATCAWSVSVKTIYAFDGSLGITSSGLTFDAKGNAYGTLMGTGNNAGGIYQLSPSSGYHTIYVFNGSPDGGQPQGNLAIDVNGNIYGATVTGGTSPNCDNPPITGCGIVFMLAPPANGIGLWTETILYNFDGGESGLSFPNAGVALDKEGNIYGTAPCCSYGYGSIFRLVPVGNGQWDEETLHTFTTLSTGFPRSTPVFDHDGNFYGTTSGDEDGDIGGGTVWKLWHDGAFSILYTFTDQNDGYYPWRGVAFDAAGNLYGTTKHGGDFVDCDGGCGVVYKLTQSQGTWTETTLHLFTSGEDGAYPLASVVINSAGTIYGTTSEPAIIYSLTPSQNGWIEQVLDAETSMATPLLLEHGNLYGVTDSTVFQIKP
jgi:hypothetical protein